MVVVCGSTGTTRVQDEEGRREDATGRRGAEAKQGGGRGDAEELGVQGGIHGGAALSRGAGRR